MLNLGIICPQDVNFNLLSVLTNKHQDYQKNETCSENNFKS